MQILKSTLFIYVLTLGLVSCSLQQMKKRNSTGSYNDTYSSQESQANKKHSDNETSRYVSQLPIDKDAIEGLASDSDSLIYFDRKNREFIRVKADRKELLTKIDFNPDFIVYSPDRTKIVLGRGPCCDDPHGIIIDLLTKQQYILDTNIASADFSPDSKKVAYYHEDYRKRLSVIRVSEVDSSKAHNIYKPQYGEGTSYSIHWLSEYSLILFSLDEHVGIAEMLNINPANGIAKTFTNKVFSDALPIPYSDMLTVVIAEPTYLLAGNNKESIALMDTKTGKVIKTDAPIQPNRVVWNREGITLYVLGVKEGTTGMFAIDRQGKVKLLNSGIPQQLDVSSIEQILLSPNERDLLILSSGKIDIVNLSY